MSNPSEDKPAKPGVWNVPNVLTVARIVLALVLFAIVPFRMYGAAVVLFVVAALTDFVDGWWARKFNLITQLGRVMDPLADKLLVCGVFIYLVAIPELRDIPLPCCKALSAGVYPWMVVVIILREMIVTVLRSFVESCGGDFSAKWIGKWKMGFQCIAIPACFLYLICLPGPAPDWLVYTLAVSLWATILLSLWSCLQYIVIAIRFGTRSEG